MRTLYLGLIFISFSVFSNTISIVLKDAPTKDIISYLAQETDKDIVLTENIDTVSTLQIKKSNFDKIIQSLSHIHNFHIEKDNNIYYVTKSKNKEEKSTSQNTAILESSTIISPKVITKTIQLNYAKASEIIESITKGNGNLLSENGYLHFDDRSNRIIIKDTPSSIKNLTQIIKQLDTPIEQIAIEARIVTISSENLKELGVRWGMFSRNKNSYRFSGNLEGNDLITNNLNINFPVVNNAASMVLQVASINSRVLDLELSALEQENSVEIIASPRLLTTNKKSASIKQGTEIPYAIYDKKSQTSELEFKDAVLGLEVTPHISENNQILLDLIVTQNSPANSKGASDLATIDKQELKTQVFAKHGETIVLGGIFQHLTAKGEDKVPVLGSIPMLKYLFSQRRDKISKRELIIFVTPYIIRSESNLAKPIKPTQKSQHK
ncbi:secretin [Vespertiliibacter pulmonis]|uniref:Protein transport protein HofQ n=1 Tax=Vespertiliibacter pulmonis TaxID=1443036 RepID=A0A3N4VLN4_9PAST|nr:type IV pilus secretin PilQ [Vespertiliibacter pulmonis]QLB21110.1 secretin [Vespertiliibacter pulmonis]RPE83788.1 protein transport protein HofQ [Vespertiliibacter pulmonis]